MSTRLRFVCGSSSWNPSEQRSPTRLPVDVQRHAFRHAARVPGAVGRGVLASSLEARHVLTAARASNHLDETAGTDSPGTMPHEPRRPSSDGPPDGAPKGQQRMDSPVSHGARRRPDCWSGSSIARCGFSSPGSHRLPTIAETGETAFEMLLSPVTRRRWRVQPAPKSASSFPEEPPHLLPLVTCA
jgi:hypothetical protein